MSESNQDTGQRPFFSAIITSYSISRLGDLRELLLSLRKQSTEQFEIIVVVEGSRELADRVENFIIESRFPNARVIFTPEKVGSSFQRNLGAKSAKGNVIAILDDDTLLPPNWATELMDTYSDGKIMGATGPIIPAWENRDMDWLPEELDFLIGCNRWQANKILSKKAVRNVTGSNASFRKYAYEMVGGYNTKLGALSASRKKWTRDSDKWTEIGEETELSVRIAKRNNGYIMFNPDLVVYHRIKKKANWMFMISMAFRTGRTKGILRKEFRTEKDLLSDEQGLLRSIAIRIAKQDLPNLRKNPLRAARSLLLLSASVSFVLIGFALGKFSDAPTCDP